VVKRYYRSCSANSRSGADDVHCRRFHTPSYTNVQRRNPVRQFNSSCWFCKFGILLQIFAWIFHVVFWKLYMLYLCVLSGLLIWLISPHYQPTVKSCYSAKVHTLFMYFFSSSVSEHYFTLCLIHQFHIFHSPMYTPLHPEKCPPQLFFNNFPFSTSAINFSTA